MTTDYGLYSNESIRNTTRKVIIAEETNRLIPKLSGIRPRLLAVIASYGDKNRGYLEQVVRGYNQLTADVAVMILSNIPKQIPGATTIVSELPAKDPWSLPFAHKTIFAREIENYDLFVYSEDDILFTSENFAAFLDITPQLQSEEIAGYLRYEIDPTGNDWFPDFHGHFHWKTGSLHKRGDYTVAEFSNQHSAFYIVTQSQLKKAIASGGFIREPYSASYDMLCSAATDPYTNCGFRKVICLSNLQQFLLHHLSNRYAGQMGISSSALAKQIALVQRAGNGSNAEGTDLCNVESRLNGRVWSKSYYEKLRSEILDFIPSNTTKLLSIGCGWGAIELHLKKLGMTVTALPLDAFTAQNLSDEGVEVVRGPIKESLDRLNQGRFDCILITHLLHLLPDPYQIVHRLVGLLTPGGYLVMSGPNLGSLRVLAKRIFGQDDLRKLSSYDKSGITLVGPRSLQKLLRSVGIREFSIQWFDRTPHQLKSYNLPGYLDPFIHSQWAMRAQAPESVGNSLESQSS